MVQIAKKKKKNILSFHIGGITSYFNNTEIVVSKLLSIMDQIAEFCLVLSSFPSISSITILLFR